MTAGPAFCAGGGCGADEQTSTDDGADTERHQTLGGQGTLQVAFLGLRQERF